MPGSGGEPGPVPVTVIGGYLGAGKTSLVNHLLRTSSGVRLAVLVNELGDLPIDADLIEARDDNLISIAGGCICCSYGSDLMAALMSLARRTPRPDHVLLETSGVALPGPVADSLALLADYVNDGVVILADATAVRRQASDRYLADTILRQLADADFVLLNKTDIAAPADRDDTSAWLETVAPQARLLRTEHGQVSLDVIAGTALNCAAGDIRRQLGRHTPDIYDTVTLSVTDPVDAMGLATALADPRFGLLRTKGAVHGLDGRLWSVQTVGARGEALPARSQTKHVGRIVCIGLKSRLDREQLLLLPRKFAPLAAPDTSRDCY